MTGPPLIVMLVAAEASGDERGAGLARALKAKLGDRVRLVGVGGARMAAEGILSPFDISELSILGLVEGLVAWRRVVRRAEETAALAVRETPDVAVLIDSWGFTLRAALRLRRDRPGMPLVKYVAPQVWASRPGRARTLARAFDLLLTIHRFDAPAFEAHGLKTVFVGDATLNLNFSQADPMRLRTRLGLGDAPVLLIAPGSRPSEIKRVLPPFAEAARILKAERPELQVIIPAASTVADAVKAHAARWPFKVHVVEGEADKLDAMRAATIALACSGTVTTQLAVAGCPMVVGYRLAPLTHAILKRLIRTPWVTLFNVAAKDFVAPELIQDDCNGRALAREVALRLDDQTRRRDQISRQTAALTLMGKAERHPDEVAADAVLGLLTDPT